MSTFGGPGGRQLNTKPIPAYHARTWKLSPRSLRVELGIFSSNQFTQSKGECTESMTKYLSCVKKSKGNNNSECREIAKSYLACRMEK
ncbi:hypothetical protein Golomagni_03517 [Golovinomyces magnicellulatus]|nr:hypothetical protein Golomagni_03517 [Golovinomyces magnicellulatus]